MSVRNRYIGNVHIASIPGRISIRDRLAHNDIGIVIGELGQGHRWIGRRRRKRHRRTRTTRGTTAIIRSLRTRWIITRRTRRVIEARRRISGVRVHQRSEFHCYTVARTEHHQTSRHSQLEQPPLSHSRHP